jgi:heat shock protein HspQ
MVPQRAARPAIFMRPLKGGTRWWAAILRPAPEPALKSRAAPAISAGMKARDAKFALGQVVKHRVFPFRGVIFDVDPEFSNTEEWWQAIPAEIRPRKDQPFYHLLAENAESEYIAYVSEQNLLPDTSGEPLRHPQIADVFDRDDRGGYRMRMQAAN